MGNLDRATTFTAEAFQKGMVGCMGCLIMVIHIRDWDEYNQDGSFHSIWIMAVWCMLFRMRFYEALKVALLNTMLFILRYLPLPDILESPRINFRQEKVGNAINAWLLYEEYKDRGCVMNKDDFSTDYWKNNFCLLGDYIWLQIGISLTSLGSLWLLELHDRKQYLLYSELIRAEARRRNILDNMLPPFVVERLVRTGGSDLIADDIGTITIAFCDVMDFSSLVMSLEPVQLVGLLNQIFSACDNICSMYGVTKIETVGETYLACGG